LQVFPVLHQYRAEKGFNLYCRRRLLMTVKLKALLSPVQSHDSITGACRLAQPIPPSYLSNTRLYLLCSIDKYCSICVYTRLPVAYLFFFICGITEPPPGGQSGGGSLEEFII